MEPSLNQLQLFSENHFEYGSTRISISGFEVEVGGTQFLEIRKHSAEQDISSIVLPYSAAHLLLQALSDVVASPQQRILYAAEASSCSASELQPAERHHELYETSDKEVTAKLGLDTTGMDNNAERRPEVKSASKGAGLSGTRCVYVTGFTRAVTAADLHQHLSQAGEVIDVELHKAKYSNFALVMFESEDAVQVAVDQLHKTELKGAPLRVRRDQGKPPKKQASEGKVAQGKKVPPGKKAAGPSQQPREAAGGYDDEMNAGEEALADAEGPPANPSETPQPAPSSTSRLPPSGPRRRSSSRGPQDRSAPKPPLRGRSPRRTGGGRGGGSASRGSHPPPAPRGDSTPRGADAESAAPAADRPSQGGDPGQQDAGSQGQADAASAGCVAETAPAAVSASTQQHSGAGCGAEMGHAAFIASAVHDSAVSETEDREASRGDSAGAPPGPAARASKPHQVRKGKLITVRGGSSTRGAGPEDAAQDGEGSAGAAPERWGDDAADPGARGAGGFAGVRGTVQASRSVVAGAGADVGGRAERGVGGMNRKGKKAIKHKDAAEFDDNRVVVVSDLGRHIWEETLSQFMARAGTVTGVDIMLNQTALVEYATTAEALNATQTLNKGWLHNRKLKIRMKLAALRGGERAPLSSPEDVKPPPLNHTVQIRSSDGAQSTSTALSPAEPPLPPQSEALEYLNAEVHSAGGSSRSHTSKHAPSQGEGSERRSSRRRDPYADSDDMASPPASPGSAFGGNRAGQGDHTAGPELSEQGGETDTGAEAVESPQADGGVAHRLMSKIPSLADVTQADSDTGVEDCTEDHRGSLMMRGVSDVEQHGPPVAEGYEGDAESLCSEEGQQKIPATRGTQDTSPEDGASGQSDAAVSDPETAHSSPGDANTKGKSLTPLGKRPVRQRADRAVGPAPAN